MTTPKRISSEDLPLITPVRTFIPNSYQPIGKWRWLASSAVSLAGTGGVGYISIQSFISKAVVTGGVLGAGSLICAGACAYCMYRFVITLRTRNIESITLDDESTLMATTLRPIHNQLSRILSQTEQRVENERLQESINQQLRELEKLQPRTIEPNTSVLQTIDVRLRTVLNIELEEGLDGERLHESINQLLAHLEQTLPKMSQQLVELQAAIQNVMANRFTGSQNSSGYNSPSVDSSRENELLSKLDKWSKQVAKDQSSRNASRLPSVYSSPVTGYAVTFTPKPTPTRANNEKPPTLNLDAINGSESDSEDGKK